jgi:hypothetical protein
LRYWPSTFETKIKNKQYAEQTLRQEHITASSESKNLRVNPFILKKLSWPKSAGLLVSPNEEELRSKLPLLGLLYDTAARWAKILKVISA